MSNRVDALYSGATELQARIRPAVRLIANRLWRFELQGFERLPETGPAILCANHVSFLDSAFLIIQAPRNISFVGKSEYLDSWKTRRLFPALGMIPIDREGGEKAQTALNAAEKVLQRGELFGIFPEGTRSRDGMLYKGKTGAARLAMKLDCPIFPVGIIGTREIQPPDAKLPRVGGRVKITIGKPILPARYSHRSDDHLVLREMTDEVMFEIQSMTGQQYRNVYAGKKHEEQTAKGEAHINSVGTAK
ncbi:1-acyl-sn-glycerol-3-phosphate acyltransferase [Actinomycetes bacterium]|nr:1-acyl-sn-glycerol-3-phosphate acyltransferase [Actinomycetes bacterium]